MSDENEYDAIVTRERGMLDKGMPSAPGLDIRELVNVRGHALDLSIEYNRGDTDYAIIKSAQNYANFVLEGTLPEDTEAPEAGTGEPTGGTQGTAPVTPTDPSTNYVG